MGIDTTAENVSNPAATEMIISAGRAIVDGGTRLEREAGYPHWTAGFMLKGRFELTTRHKLFRVEARGCAIIPPNTPYELKISRKQDQIWMIFDPREHLLESLIPKGRSVGVRTIRFDDDGVWIDIRDGLEALLRWWSREPPHLALAENAMEKVLLTACWEDEGRRQDPVDMRSAKVVGHITHHLAEELSVESLAALAGLSPSRFAHLFKDQMGVTPMGFLESRRIEQARQLLLGTDLSIQQIAWETGFPNSQHFSTRFRKLCGQSPSAFRKATLRSFGELFPKE